MYLLILNEKQVSSKIFFEYFFSYFFVGTSFRLYFFCIVITSDAHTIFLLFLGGGGSIHVGRLIYYRRIEIREMHLKRTREEKLGRKYCREHPASRHLHRYAYTYIYIYVFMYILGGIVYSC